MGNQDAAFQSSAVQQDAFQSGYRREIAESAGSVFQADAFQADAFQTAFVAVLPLADVPVRTIRAWRAAPDEIGLVDALGATWHLWRSAGDVLETSDSFLRRLDAFRRFVETLGITDQLDRVVWAVREASEALGAADDFGRALEAARGIADTLDFAEAVYRRVDAFRTLLEPDGFGLADQTARNLQVVRQLLDMLLDYPDSVSATGAAQRLALELLWLADTIDRLVKSYRQPPDAAGLADGVFFWIDRGTLVPLFPYATAADFFGAVMLDAQDSFLGYVAPDAEDPFGSVRDAE